MSLLNSRTPTCRSFTFSVAKAGCIAVALSLTGLFSTQAHSATEVNWCVFDAVGANGPSKSMVDDYKVAAVRWDVSLKTQYFTDDQKAAEAYNQGACDMVTLPDFRVRQFNQFTGSINAVATIPSYKHMGTVIKSLSSPSAKKVMVNGEHEVVGIFLVGGVHGFVTDRTWVTPEQMEGKKVAVLEGIEESDYFNEQTKTIPIKSDLGTVFSNFKNGVVDATLAPLIVFEGLELEKGLGANGGISRYPMSMITMQVVVRHAALPEGFGQKSREYAASYHPKMVKTVESFETAVPEKYYFDVPMETVYYFDNLFSKARRDLAEKGIYNQKMLKLLRKVRCQSYPDRDECLL